MAPPTIPLTVIGGYLGAGKTTLVNRLLRDPGGRRIGVIVNDFGSLAIDVGLLAASVGDDGPGIVSLPNGCVCCTIADGLHEALVTLAERVPPVDQVVIEVSGVADPAATAAWGTVPPFEPAGVIVLADATSVRERAGDRYVGAEVTRQLRGADLVVVTKSDVCDERRVLDVEEWLARVSGGAPAIRVVGGEIDADLVLGVRPGAPRTPSEAPEHDDRYESWAWTSTEAVSRMELEEFLASLAVLRVKGRVRLDDGSWAVVQVVGRRVDVTPSPPADRSELVAIAVRRDPPQPSPFAPGFG